MMRILTYVTIVMSLAAAAAGAEPECWEYVQIQEYFSTIYVAPPAEGATFVFLQGQPIRLRVLVANEGDRPEIVRPQDAPDTPAVLTSASKGGRAVSASFQIGEPVVVERTAPSAPARYPVRLAPGESLQWSILVTLPSNATGMYSVRMTPRVVSGPGRSIRVNNDGFGFEVRPVSTTADRVEELRINATRALVARDYEAAEQYITRLLAVHPAAVFGYLLRGDAALKRGRLDEAHAAYEKCLELLRSGADHLYLAHATEHQRQEMIENVEAKLRR